ncbi:hypothetical protein [Cribrihabitans neustonicus]|uniref:hypothetical protein n=1 Tax=Cribrihabitans neustonicus TaxID=1429085 RepID=UPI003B590513
MTKIAGDPKRRHDQNSGLPSQLKVNMIVVPSRPTPLEPNTRMGDPQRLNEMRFNEGFPHAFIV